MENVLNYAKSNKLKYLARYIEENYKLDEEKPRGSVSWGKSPAGSKAREEYPDHIYLRPGSKTYPVKSWNEPQQKWEYDKERIRAAISVANMQGNTAVSKEASALLKDKFGDDVRNDSQTVLTEAVRKILADKNKNIQWVYDVSYDTEKRTLFAVYEKRMVDDRGNDLYPAQKPIYRRDFNIDSDTGYITLKGREYTVERKTVYE